MARTINPPVRILRRAIALPLFYLAKCINFAAQWLWDDLHEAIFHWKIDE